MTYEDYIKAHEARLYAEYHQGDWVDEVDFDVFCSISYNEYKANTISDASYEGVTAHIGGDIELLWEADMEAYATEEYDARRQHEKYLMHKEQQ